MEDKQLIHDEQCEREVISVLLTNANAYNDSADLLSADVFYFQRYKIIYNAVAGVGKEGNVPNLVAVNAYLQSHPAEEVIEQYQLAQIAAAAITDITFRANCSRLADLYTRRRMWQIGVKLMTSGTSEVGETAVIRSLAIEELQKTDEMPQTSIVTTKDALASLDEIVKANLSGNVKRGIPTGFQYLDNKGGLWPTDLVVVAAEFSQGKTSLALDMCINAAKRGYEAAFYSLEMMSNQLAARMAASESGISCRTIMQSPLTDNQLRQYDEALGRLMDLPIFFDERSTISVERIIASIRTMARRKDVKVAFIDYLQILQTNGKEKGQTEEQFFGTVARRLKNLAKELGICVVLLSQLARSKDTTEPKLDRLRGSGQIAEAADVVLLIYRPEVYRKKYSGDYSNIDPKGTAQITIAKGRNIGYGSFICGYDAPTTHFYELTTIPRLEKTTSIDEEEPF
jgi:Replicative DNA helicase